MQSFSELLSMKSETFAKVEERGSGGIPPGKFLRATPYSFLQNGPGHLIFKYF